MSARLRFLLGWLAALCITLVVWRAEADGVREGTTSLDPIESAKQSSHATPSDAPRLEGELPRIPTPPASFNTYDGGWIRFVYPPGVRERVQPLIAQADDARADLKARLGQNVLDSVTVHIARTPAEMASLAPANAPYPKYAGGVAYSQIGLVLLTITAVEPGANHDLNQIFRHELAHVALHDAAPGRAVPRWFNEGLAVFVSGESSFVRMQTLFQATVADRLLPLRQLEHTFPADGATADVAYAQAADVVRFLLRQQDRHRFTAMIERVRKGQAFDSALSDAYGTDLSNLEFEWREDVARRYTFWPVFFSGSMVWAAALGLFVWGWRRKRKQQKTTLERWAREEAAEDATKPAVIDDAEQTRVHIVLARPAQRTPPLGPPAPDPDVPKVEHDGRWHTLH